MTGIFANQFLLKKFFNPYSGVYILHLYVYSGDLHQVLDRSYLHYQGLVYFVPIQILCWHNPLNSQLLEINQLI